MSFRDSSLILVLGLGMIVSITVGSRAGEQQGEIILGAPSLQALKLLDYAKADSAKQADPLGYNELTDLIDACQAYSKGLDALPRFHEPILTRGETGTEIFKKVSPSVVMVVTADRKSVV